jgi:hypothetical protein
MARKKTYKFRIKIEFDIISKGETQEEAIDNAADMFIAQLTYLLDNYHLPDYIENTEVISVEEDDEHKEDE